MRYSIIVPVYNGGEEFKLCLQSIAELDPKPHEVIVVDDGSTDGSGDLARASGAEVLQLSGPNGPARARNRGAAKATGDVIYFVDADVTVEPGALAHLSKRFAADPELAAIIGSYDDAPAAPGFFAQYKNLIHHYTHQIALPEGSTFWGACGAIVKKVFDEMNGFDESYERPCIEDIELGYRLRAAGYRILLDRDLQIKHLKAWTLRSMLVTDFFQRALPWTELILKAKSMPKDLNLDQSSRISVALTGLIPIALLAALWWTGALWIALALFLVLLAINWHVYRFFFRKRGLWFALRVIPMHYQYYFYGGMAFAIGTLRHWLSGQGSSSQLENGKA
ncbi:MAG: glycosyltransferase family 2 protein [Planctomycetota bacterium]|jgi:glycosyltransferase involved in cell wall biosynthesis